MTVGPLRLERARLWSAYLLLASVMALMACSSGTSADEENFMGAGGAPSVTSIAPTSYVASTNLQTMTINGSGFPSNATLTFASPHGGAIQSTASRLIYISSTQLSYKFNSGGDAGDWSVVVHTPSGLTSNPFSFTVR
ncbi:MAG: IPT/TIG domain-containing protein [bacterium]